MNNRLSWILIVLCASTFHLMGQAKGVIQGRIYDAISNEPIPFANVVIQTTTTGGTTDIDGNYRIENLEPNLYNLEISYIGYQKQVIYEIQVSNAKPANVNIGLEQSAEQLDAVVVTSKAFDKPKESPLSLRTIGVNEIRRNPGGERDISKAVQILPGVASTPTFRNDILIRGGASNENKFYIDGIEIPTINHFATQGATGGPVGIINVDFVKEVDFYSGAFPANRGNALSSIFDFQFKQGRTDRLGFTSTVGSSDFGVTLEGPLGRKVNFILSARRSYLQLLFKLLDLPFLPTYNDAQYKLRYEINQQNILTFIGIGAIDQFKLNLSANETELQRYILGNIPENGQWNYTQGIKYTNFQKNNYTNVVLSRSHLKNYASKYSNNEVATENLILDYDSEEIEHKLRAENISRIKGYKFIAGGNYEFVQYKNRTVNRIPVNGELVEVDYDSKLNFHKWGLFAQASKSFVNERLSLSLGFRADANSYSKEMSNLFKQFSPRFSASYALSTAVSLNFNTGIYYQLPSYTVLGYEEAGERVNKNNGVTYMKNEHIVGGVEWSTGKNSRVTLEGFYKRYSQYPFSLNDSISLANLGGDFGVVGDEAVTSSNDGRAYGLELLFQQKLYKGFYGIVSYTLSWSEFQDKQGVYVASSWDSRHIINLTAGKKFKKNWEVGLKWRFSTGPPYTPYDRYVSAIQEIWDVRGEGVPDYNQLNAERIPAYHGLDMRVDKKFFFKKWNMNLYFDLQNVYRFKTQFQPYLNVEQDENGEIVVDPNDPSRYLLHEIENFSDLTQPTLGFIIEL